MLSKTMLLALGRPAVREILRVTGEAVEDTQRCARREVDEISRSSSISGHDLMALAQTGRKLVNVEQAHARLDRLDEFWDNNGNDPAVQAAIAKERARRKRGEDSC